jgi:hypothetical protein
MTRKEQRSVIDKKRLGVHWYRPDQGRSYSDGGCGVVNRQKKLKENGPITADPTPLPAGEGLDRRTVSC